MDRHERLFEEIENGRYAVSDKTYAMQSAIECNRPDVIQKMFQVGTKLIDPSRGYVMAALKIAHEKNDPNMLKMMAQVGMDINGNRGFPILHEYLDTYRNTAKPEVVQAMLQAGFKMDSRDFQGMTPLHHAALHGNEKVVTALIDASASLEVLSNQCDYALDLAKKNHHEPVLDVIHQAERDRASQDLDFTPSREQSRGMVH